MKLFAIITFGIFIFFCGTTLECIRNVIGSDDLNLRWLSFGVMWIQLIGVVFAGVGTYAIIRYVPWKLKL